MQKWEYRTVKSVRGDLVSHVDGNKVENQEPLKRVIGKLGKDGWELIAVTGDEPSGIHQLFFKRPATQE